MKILILGFNGYLGSGLSSYFENKGYELVYWGSKEDLFKLTKQTLESLKINLIINCVVAPFTPKINYELNSLDEKINIFGVRHLIEILNGMTIPLIHFSSKEIYGAVSKSEDVIETETRYTPKFYIDDLQPFKPGSSYSKTKLIGEIIASSYPFCNVIRISSCFTDYDHKRGNWMVNIYKSILNNQPIRVTGNGKQIRDPVHASDVGELIEKMFFLKKWGIQLNVGGGPDLSISILEYIKLINKNAKIEYVEGNDFGFISNNRIAKEIWNWSPKISVQNRLETILKNINHSKLAVNK